MKKTDKGFSLVELIIVIAIMAILAGAIAPALIRYIDKSRKSNDVSSCKTIKTAVETAIGNEDIYEYLVSCSSGLTIIEITPNQTTLSATAINNEGGGISISGLDESKTGAANLDIDGDDVVAEIGTNIGEKTPKIKYKKTVTKSASGLDADITPAAFYAVISAKGTVYVGVGAAGQSGSTIKVDSSGDLEGIIEIAPNVNKAYQ